MPKLHPVFLITILVLIAPSAIAKSYKHWWQEWQQDYEKEVSGPGGWLSLAGLYWLEQGDSTLGSAEDNDHLFPKDTPAHLGKISVLKDKVIFSTTLDSVKVAGKPIKSVQLSEKDETKVHFDHYEFFILKREKGYAIRLVDTTPQKDTNFTQFMPFDDNWIVTARYVAPAPEQKIRMATVYGTTRENYSAGFVEFKVNGDSQRLEAVDYGPNEPMLILFTDTTNDETTYSAGRYIKVGWPNKKGNTLIDFNRAYNPPCAYTEYATCPLAPRQNRLEIPIRAGELNVSLE